jgi:Uma2 family endonuclease
MGIPVMFASPVPSLSPEEYLEWEEKSEVKHEYIDGEVFAMAGSSGKHAVIVKNFILTVGPHLRGSGCDLYPQDIKAKVSRRKRYYYPDLMVTCDDRDKPDDYVKRHYKMIVEVLSDSTEKFDRGDKFEDYRRSQSLEEYVLISQNRMHVEVYRKNIAGRWELQAYYRGDRVELASIGLEFAIEDLYEDVTLPPEEADEMTDEMA